MSAWEGWRVYLASLAKDKSVSLRERVRSFIAASSDPRLFVSTPDQSRSPAKEAAQAAVSARKTAALFTYRTSPVVTASNFRIFFPAWSFMNSFAWASVSTGISS